MKKLISAAASLAMAASMVSSAVPFMTGAADATKGFELRTYLDKDGKEVSSTVSADAIKAGAVTVPVGVFLTEATPDSDSLSAQFTVKSADGDASNTYVTFKKHEAGDVYFSSPRAVTLANGTSGNTDSLIGFAGEIVNDEYDGDFFNPTVKGQSFAEPNSKSAKTDNAFGSFAMTAPGNGKGYKWSGATSDAYPVYVVDVVFAQNTPAGTYSIEFCNYVPEEQYPDNWSCMIESPAGKMTTKSNKLTLKNLEIKVEGEGGAPVTTTTTQGGGQDTTTTTIATVTPPPSGNVDADFIIKPKDVEVNAGEDAVIDIMCENGSNRKAGQFIAQVIDANLPIAGATATMTATRCSAVSGTHVYENINGTWYCDTLDSGEPQEINTDKPVARFTISVPATAAAGEYEWKLDRFHVVENGYDAVEFDANLKTGIIKVNNGSGVTTTTTTTKTPDTTTTTTTTATTAPATTTTTTTATAKPGTLLYGDTNCDGKVNIADVVVLNKWLNDANSYEMKAQGKINADCCDAKGGDGLDANDSDAIIKSIVHLVKSLPCSAADLG